MKRRWRRRNEISLKAIRLMNGLNVKDMAMGVGMPAALLLEEFGSQVWNAFGEPPYLVGSALAGKDWRDVDVRLILDDEKYAAMELGDPEYTHHNAKWVSLCLAYSALGKALTGLPIDFQIQQTTYANNKFKESRSALGMTPWRLEHVYGTNIEN